MPNYHFFKLDQVITYLDANAPRYSDERRQLVVQGFAAIATPTFADTPAEALELLRHHQVLLDEVDANSLCLTVTAISEVVATRSGR